MKYKREVKLMGTVVAILLALGLTGCAVEEAVPVFSTQQECTQLQLAENVIQTTAEKLAEDYTAEYFESEMWTVFVDSYWQGFWEGHKYCEICVANEDVPQ